jgi:hypothetical protein
VVPVHAALCFIESEWKLFGPALPTRRVWVTWAKKLAEMIAEPGPLTTVDMVDIANRLVTALPPVPSKR